jgi:transmembrane sensor
MQEEDAHDRKWYLAGKFLTSGLTPEEQTEWDALQDDAGFSDEFSRMKVYWEMMGTLPYGKIDPAADWKTVLKKVSDETQTVHSPARWLRYAAVITACVMASALTWWATRNEIFGSRAASLTTIVAPTGSKTSVTLPDSSTVWLNAGSRISFDDHFGKSNRHVVLEGEGFFDVKKNTVPFTVHTDQFDVAVLGTAFNVRAYRDDDRATATLVRGSLKVKRENLSGSQDEILLVPNDKLTLWKNGMAEKASSKTAFKVDVEKKIDTEKEISWKDGWLSVQGESLDELATKLERLYDITIEFEEGNLKAYRYTGRIRQLSLEQVLKALALTSPIAFTIEEKKVTLREDKIMKSKYQSLQTP